MKLNKIALALVATAATAASAGVTVTPLVGYQYQDEAHKKQREIFKTGQQLNNANTNAPTNPTNGGVALESDLYTGIALGVELTPSTQFQVEYGVTDTDARASKASANASPNNVFDAKEEIISGNFLIGTEQFSGYTNNKFKPYVLIGAGQAKYKVESRQDGSEVSESKDTIGNLGLGARYLINDALALRGEARAVHNFDNAWWEGQALAGLEVTLGGRLAPTVPVAPIHEPVVQPVQVLEEQFIDSDGDGVADHLDLCPDTPRNLRVDANGCPVIDVVGEDLRMELRVFFDRDKSNIKPQFREEVAKVADKMREFPNATAAIEGHASKDSKRSSAKYNQRLSEARANAVKSMLSNEFGIAPNRISAVGYGFDRPVAPNDTAENKALNRRVYAVIQGNKVTEVPQTK
ncbi:Outer membrane protein OmpAb [Moraxella lacunata]|uniref:Outer membrane protein OmpAb n=1 Tax=Moraxella lacunata TaxID=477 RepID=A0A378TPV9_MORLA|nr:OmpA family protein [Moraxella lacunata]STZ62816.1 Outer membrane protein OmpAb [Moraxella lacunata]